LIKTWNGLGVASNELGISKENISAVCLRKKTKLGASRLSAGGYQWRFADDCDDITPYKRKEKDYSKNMYKKVARIDDDGNILEIFDGYTSNENIDELINNSLDSLIDELKPHGLWEVGYKWETEYPEEESAMLKHMGNITYKNLYLLKKFDRI
jgi:hypothetical protein